jgi:hypothetical protein
MMLHDGSVPTITCATKTLNNLLSFERGMWRRKSGSLPTVLKTIQTV